MGLFYGVALELEKGKDYERKLEKNEDTPIRTNTINRIIEKVWR